LGILSEFVFLIVLARAMLEFTTHYQLTRSARSWRTSFRLALLVYSIPILLLAIAFVVLKSLVPPKGWYFSGNNSGLDAKAIAFLLGLAAVIAIIVMPVIHLLISYARTIREAKANQVVATRTHEPIVQAK